MDINIKQFTTGIMINLLNGTKKESKINGEELKGLVKFEEAELNINSRMIIIHTIRQLLMRKNILKN